jgi:hypothetical protein
MFLPLHPGYGKGSDVVLEILTDDVVGFLYMLGYLRKVSRVYRYLAGTRVDLPLPKERVLLIVAAYRYEKRPATMEQVQTGSFAI